MNRAQLEHIIRAASLIVDENGVVIIGSQAILGNYRDTALPASLCRSMEADVLPLNDDEVASQADAIDGAIGEFSPFHDLFGIYAQGVSPETPILAVGWVDRLVPVVDPASGKVGWCLDVHDLCASKLLAARPKDVDFVEAVLTHRLADPVEIERLVGECDTDTGRAVAAIAVLHRVHVDEPFGGWRGWWKRRRGAVNDRRLLAPVPTLHDFDPEAARRLRR